MRYDEVLKEFLPKVFKQIKQDILKDEEIFLFISSREHLEKLLNKQEEIITEYLENFPENTSINEGKIETFYKNLKIPFPVIARIIEKLKTKLLERLILEKELQSEEYLLQVKNYIDNLTSQIAKIYIKAEIHKIGDMENTIFNKYLLYKAHTEFIDRIISAVETENLDDFPLKDDENCNFHRYLSYPESQMVFLDPSIKEYIQELHSLIHRISASFYVSYLKGKYLESYSIFKELLDTILKMSKKLSELYFIAYADIETNFFKYISSIEKNQINKYIYVININSLKQMNRVYGEEAINNLLSEIKSKLEAFVNPKRKNILMIKGITSDFYIFAKDYKDEEIEDIMHKLKDIVEGYYKINGNKVNITASIGVLKLDTFEQESKDEIIKILLYIKQNAKRNKINIYKAITQEEKHEVKKVLIQKYKDSIFVKEKLQNHEIDVVFQPIFDKDLKIYAVESLARIKDNETLIPAGVFIDTLYELNLVSALDILVLEKLKEKQKIIKYITDTIFINVSSESLMSINFMESFYKFLKEMKQFNIVLELTEQKLVEEFTTLQKLKNTYKNLKFAIDDFGSGYSSLRLVADLSNNKTLDIVKIDGSLIKNLKKDNPSYKIVKIISSMTKNLSLKSVAEFVEDRQIQDMLLDLGIDLLQGYYLSTPKPIEDLIYKPKNVSVA